MDALRRFWNCHVQQFLGIFEMVTGLLEYVDGQTINLVGSFFGPKWGPIISKSLQIGAGLLVAYRGYQVRREHR